MIGGLGNDLLNGGIDDDLLRGGEEDDIIRGLDGRDIVSGEAGNDLVHGGAGNDIIIGGSGFDTMIGGTGFDRFQFYSFENDMNKIKDFRVVDDTIEISASGFGGGLVAGKKVNSQQLVIGTKATSPEQRFIYNPTNGMLSFDRDGSLAAFTQTAIADLNSNLALTDRDIFIIN